MLRLKGKYIFVIILLSLSLGSIYGFQDKNAEENRVKDPEQENLSTEIFEVSENPVFCEQIVPRKCLNIKREGEKKFRALWDQIENFQFIEGYRYTLRVEIKKIKYPPKDTSGFKYFLKEIIKREKVQNSSEKKYLPQSKWLLTHIKGEKIKGGKPFLVFNPEEKSFYGNTGCNSMSGSFRFEDDAISFFQIRQTKMACSNSETVEKPFVKVLSGENKIKIEVDRVYFYQKGKIVLEFKSNWD